MGVNGGGIWVVRETSPVWSLESLNGSTSLLSYVTVMSLLSYTLSLGDCIKNKIQPIRICQITDKSVSLGNHKISVITRSA